MKTIRIDELVKVWQQVEYVFKDDVDLSSKEKIMSALENCEYYECSVNETFWETEEHLEWDETSIKELEKQ